MGLTRKSGLRALLLVFLFLQIRDVVATSRKIVPVDKLTPHQIEEELQVYLPFLISFFIIVSLISVLLSLQLLPSSEPLFPSLTA
jgi:membrane-bound acyltransferase YfiQ involved in biofilm formation